MKLPLLLSSLFLFLGCSPGADQQTVQEPLLKDPMRVESFSIRSPEIRHDIVTALTQLNIEHWVNDDGSISFYSKDSETVDAVGYEAIGAYAARN